MTSNSGVIGDKANSGAESASGTESDPYAHWDSVSSIRPPPPPPPRCPPPPQCLRNSSSIIELLETTQEPKLAPFRSEGSPLDLEFVQYLGTGLHAHVWKVRIGGQVYALKMVWDVYLDEEEQIRYMHPFYCEARAYARIHEQEQDHIAVACYGYLLLDRDHQLALRVKDELDWSEDWGYNFEMEGHAPMMALVKEFVHFKHDHLILHLEDDASDREYERLLRVMDGPATARRLYRNMKTMHRIGIALGDLHTGNVAHGRFLDFSVAWTKPHPCLDTAAIEDRSRRSGWGVEWQLGLKDANALDGMIERWNRRHPKRGHISLRVVPDQQFLKRLRSHAVYDEDNCKPKPLASYYPGRPDKYNWELNERRARARKQRKEAKRRAMLDASLPRS